MKRVTRYGVNGESKDRRESIFLLEEKIVVNNEGFNLRFMEEIGSKEELRPKPTNPPKRKRQCGRQMASPLAGMQ